MDTETITATDVPQLEQQLRGLLMFGLADKLERELINGMGTAGTIDGLMSIACAHVATGAAADRVGHAGAALAALGWMPSLVILNPANWFAIASERGIDGYVVSGGWNLPPSPNLWAN